MQRIALENKWKHDASKNFTRPTSNFSSLQIIGHFNIELLQEIALTTNLRLYYIDEDNSKSYYYIAGAGDVECEKDPIIFDTIYRLRQGIGGKCIVEIDGPIPEDALEIQHFSSGQIEKFDVSEIQNGKRAVIDVIILSYQDKNLHTPELNCNADQNLNRCILDSVLGFSTKDAFKSLTKKPESSFYRRLKTLARFWNSPDESIREDAQRAYMTLVRDLEQKLRRNDNTISRDEFEFQLVNFIIPAIPYVRYPEYRVYADEIRNMLRPQTRDNFRLEQAGRRENLPTHPSGRISSP